MNARPIAAIATALLLAACAQGTDSYLTEERQDTMLPAPPITGAPGPDASLPPVSTAPGSTPTNQLPAGY